jgi:hypothetical protein
MTAPGAKRTFDEAVRFEKCHFRTHAVQHSMFVALFVVCDHCPSLATASR